MRRLSLSLVLLLGLSLTAGAQPEGLLQIDDPLHRFLLRQQALGRLPDAFLSHQPLSAYEARRYLDSLAAHTHAFSPVDLHQYTRFRGDVAAPGTATFRRALPFTYRDGEHFFSAEHEDYALHIDPLFYLSYGRARLTDREGQEPSGSVWQNTRGARAAGHVGRHVFFEARLEENQRRDAWPAFGSSTAPRLGYVKFDAENGVYDYWQATGVVGVRSRYFEVRLGRDRNRWGFGEGSLLLSNYPTAYDQLQLRTTVWRFQYTNLFASLSVPNTVVDALIPRKYGAFHRLAVNLPGRFQAEFFEAIQFPSGDTLGLRDAGFDLTYLNPIILLRAVEADRGSTDNAFLGAGLSWVAVPGLQVYGSLLLDELRVSEIGNGWWANKWAWLVGTHVTDLPFANLAVRAEYARLRPYLYSHSAPTTAYLHFGDLLGHPAGPNAQDLAVFVDYQPRPRLRGAFTLAYTQRGRNTATENFGADPAVSYDTRVAERGVNILQGVRQNTLLVEGHLGYEFMPAAFFELALRAESVDDAVEGPNRYVAPLLLLRWGLPFQSVRY